MVYLDQTDVDNFQKRGDRDGPFQKLREIKQSKKIRFRKRWWDKKTYLRT